jgi:cytochrome o ubiquinol oxidase operon protein cyoD
MNTLRHPEAEKRTPVVEGGTFGTYLAGFGLSILLTLVAFELVTKHIMNGTGLVVVIIGLALVQFWVQLFFFLHLGREARPRWKLLVLAFMMLVVLILVIGSLWIMGNLNYRMTPQQINNYMQNQDGGI